MTGTTTRFGLELIEPGQAQKELFHNEALALIDLGLQAAVAAAGLDAPPSAPVPGACWIVGAVPTGAWAGHPRALAGWTENGWRFLPPREGMTAWDEARKVPLRFSGGGWEAGIARATELRVGGERVVGGRQPAIALPAGGTTVDVEARGALAAVIRALREHGLIAT